jgi:Tfp pilus tip-associated adhesin PilY1
VTLLEQTEIDWRIISGYYYRTLSNNEPNWATIDDLDTDQLPDPGSTDTGETVHAGWYFSLIHSSQASSSPEGERVVRNVVIRDGKAIVISTTPNSSPCSGGGDSIIHEIDAATGGRLRVAQMDINDDGVIDENDLITPNDPYGNPIIDNDGNPIKVPPSGKEFTGVLYQAVFLTMPDKVREMKLFSTSAATTETVFEKAEKKSMVYWRVR